jgi:hypothetical protein
MLHYDIKDWDPEALIFEINNKTETDFNEQLERQYNDLNKVDKYVVDHFESFEKGMILENIKIEGYGSTGISKKLNSICDCVRMRKKAYEEEFGDYGGVSAQIRVYKIKPESQIRDLYNIIKYKAYQSKPQNEDSSAEIDEKPY